MEWIYGCVYIAGAIVTWVAIYTLNKIPPEASFLLGIVWPLSVIGYATYGLIQLPQALRDYKRSRVARKRQEELDYQQHLTALATERVKQVELQKRELDALGLPTSGLDP